MGNSRRKMTVTMVFGKPENNSKYTNTTDQESKDCESIISNATDVINAMDEIIKNGETKSC